MPQPGTTGTERVARQQAFAISVIEGNEPSTATAVAGAATLNQGFGIVTTESLTTVATATYTLTLTNSVIDANCMIFTTIWNGTNTTGLPTEVTSTPGAGSATIVIQNTNSVTAFGGTLKIGFMVVRKAAVAL